MVPALVCNPADGECGMTNYAANIFTVRAPLATLEAVARYMGCKSQRDADGALRFDLTGRHDAATYEAGDELARRFPDARILCAYHPESCNFLLGGVAAWAGGEQQYLVSFLPCHEADYTDPAELARRHLLVLFRRLPQSLTAIRDVGLDAHFGRLRRKAVLARGWRIVSEHAPHEITLIWLPETGEEGEACVLALYPSHARAWFFGAVDTYGGFGSTTAVSLDIIRQCVPVLPHWVITEWERAERKQVATSGGAEERAAEEGEAGEILF